MSNIKLTPMQEVIAAVHDIRSKNTYEKSPMVFMQWMANNIDRLLYEEKYLVVDAYNAASDHKDDYNAPKVKSKGQVFFEQNFINL